MMNNGMFLRQQMVRNPQAFARNALNSGMFNNNPMYKNALESIVNNDTKKMEEIANNLCKEHNVTVDEARQRYNQYYGIKQRQNMLPT